MKNNQKNRTHLTPEEVQEFEGYGVYFRKSTCVWQRYAPPVVPDYIVYPSHLYLREDIRVGTWSDLNSKTLPAPNLQEVLEVLDKVYRTKASQWSWSLNPLHSKYVCSIGMITASNCIRAVGDSSLIAATNALRQLCRNYPETLTKTE